MIFSNMASLNHAFINETNRPSLFSCTIMSAKIGDTLFFGNNEDSQLKGTALWFEPARENEYAGVYFGYQGNWHPADGIVQGGMNEKGLCCDANALPATDLNPHPEYESTSIDFLDSILKECSNVSETITWFNTHNFGTTAQGQYHFMDASGEAVIISADEDGEWAFTRRTTEKYLISSNFNVANLDNGWYPCWRYNTTEEMLSEITTENELSVGSMREILEATAQEGSYPTRYSNIFDPTTLEIYIYHNHDFSTVVKYNLTEEIKNIDGTVMHKIPVIFGEPDWFFPPQPPIFVIIPAILIGIITIIIILVIKRRRKK